jgi:hypothetical protein
MKTWTRRFNSYFIAFLLGLLALAGCATDDDEKGDKKKEKKEKEVTTLEMHLEANPDGSDRCATITLLRSNPITLTVYNQPFLSHIDLVRADIVEELGILGIRLQFTQPHGARLLEMYTSANKGKRIAIRAEWGEGRWLAAPLITSQIREGVYTFTPDASREEIERIVRGLNNVGKEVEKREK